MKKIIQIICLFITTGLFAQTNFVDNKITSPKRIILLDAGHGGTDTGVKREEFQEKDIALKIATVIQEKNPFENIEFVLLRKGDEQIINTNRAKLINEIKPDLVLSLHANYNVKDSKNWNQYRIRKH